MSIFEELGQLLFNSIKSMYVLQTQAGLEPRNTHGDGASRVHVGTRCRSRARPFD